MPVGDVDRIGAETTERVRDVDNKLDAPDNICAPARSDFREHVQSLGC